MNKTEARAVLSEYLARYRPLAYAELIQRIGSTETAEMSAPSGVRYQVEVEFVWDDKPGGNVRVMGAVDDGGLRAFFPMGDDFIKGPNGEFVGETNKGDKSPS